MTLPIEAPFAAYLELIERPFAGIGSDVTEENLQARIRGNLLMALSNKFGWLLLSTPPSAELGPDQRDTDSLPPYEVLDPILAAYLERDCGIAEIVSDGCDEVDVRRVIALVGRAEYKRRQGPPGPKLTPRAFGRDRRMPIVHGFAP